MSKSTPFLIRAYNALLAREQNVGASYNALCSTTIEAERIHTGNAWLHSEPHYNIANGASLNHIIVPSSGGDVDLHLASIKYNATAGPSEVRIYEGPYINVLSYGADVTSSFGNRNRTKINERGFVVRENAYIDANSLGTSISYELVESSAGGPTKSSGGAAGASREIVLNNTKPYLLRFTNVSGGVNSYAASDFFIYRAGT